VQLSQFIKNHWFQIFKCFKIRKPPILGFKKNQNESTNNSGYFQKLKKLVVSLKEAIKNWQLYRPLFHVLKFLGQTWQTWLYIRIGSLICFEDHSHGLVTGSSVQVTRHNHPVENWNALFSSMPRAVVNSPSKQQRVTGSFA